MIVHGRLPTHRLDALCWPLVLTVCLAGPVLAQEGGFADDFSTDSTAYTSSTFNTQIGTSSAVGEPGAILLNASAEPGDASRRFLELAASTDTLSFTGEFDPESSLPGSAVAIVSLGATLYNDTADANPEEPFGAGDISFGFDMGIDGNGASAAQVCLGRTAADGSFEGIPAFGAENCSQFVNPGILPGVPFEMAFTWDRSSNSVTFSLNDATVQASLPSPVFEPRFSLRRIELNQTDGAGNASVRITSITTDSGIDDFAGRTPVVDRYRPFFDRDGVTRDASVQEGRLRLFQLSEPDSGDLVDLVPQAASDYLEAEIMLSSESNFANQGERIALDLESIAYNDTQDGGFDGQTGDVSARLQLRVRADGTRAVEYCLTRSDDADSNQRSGLLGSEGRRCDNLPLVIELDRVYRAAIALDRNAPSITFKLDGFEVEQPISTDVFNASRDYRRVGAEANNGASVIAFVDNVRTAPDALSASELESGLTAPPPFPTAPETTDSLADATVDEPFDHLQPVDFVDDFSSNAAEYGFWNDRGRRGDVGISYVEDEAAIEFQANSSDPENSGSAEFYAPGGEDGIQARVSLSSESNLPPDPDAQARIGIMGVFHNDVADGGVDGQEGDIFVELLLRLRGDGRRRAEFYMARRDAEGNSEGLRIIDGDDSGDFDGFVPELDTAYDLGIAIDRERGVLIFSLDDRVREILLPTAAFQPARSEARIILDHRGGAGRAVGRLFSVKTAEVDENFATGLPLLGPYRPAFGARYPGRSVDVIDGRLRLENDARIVTGQAARLIALGASTYVGASVELSSETIPATPDGQSVARIGGLLYNDLPESERNGDTGNVFVALDVVADGNGERYAEYCAYRSNNEDFSESVELLGGDPENCPRFELVPEFDTAYDASIELDEDNSQLVFRFGEEVATYAIGTEIFTGVAAFNGVQARSSDGSVTVAYFDDLAFSPDAVPLSESDSRLVIDPMTIGGPDDDNSSTDGGDDNGEANSSGCSLGIGSNRDPIFWLLTGFALIVLLRRQIRNMGLRPLR